ncbi:MAG: anti-sigma factor family protein, partial [Thiothrix sp.]
MNTIQSNLREQLHALADGQLDHAQSCRILALVENDPALQKALCDIQRVKHLVKSAYPLPVMPQQRHWSYNRAGWQRAAVYVLALGLASAAGAVGNHYLSQWSLTEGVTLYTASVHDNRFIVFLDSHDPGKLEKALDKAEKLATQVEGSGGGVYVVTSAEGVDLLRLGITPYEGRIF